MNESNEVQNIFFFWKKKQLKKLREFIKSEKISWLLGEFWDFTTFSCNILGGLPKLCINGKIAYYPGTLNNQFLMIVSIGWFQIFIWEMVVWDSRIICILVGALDQPSWSSNTVFWHVPSNVFPGSPSGPLQKNMGFSPKTVFFSMESFHHPKLVTLVWLVGLTFLGIYFETTLAPNKKVSAASKYPDRQMMQLVVKMYTKP